jgi:hypothetical protein
MKFFYEKTSHPGIFKNTYWGSFEIPPSSLAEMFFKNRDKFVKEFGIVSSFYSRSRLSDILGSDFCDHLEMYRTVKKQLIVVVSPYNQPSDNAPEIASSMGFRIYAPMYHPWARTFIAVFSNGTSFRKALATAKRINRENRKG